MKRLLFSLIAVLVFGATAKATITPHIVNTYTYISCDSVQLQFADSSTTTGTFVDQDWYILQPSNPTYTWQWNNQFGFGFSPTSDTVFLEVMLCVEDDLGDSVCITYEDTFIFASNPIQVNEIHSTTNCGVGCSNSIELDITGGSGPITVDWGWPLNDTGTVVTGLCENQWYSYYISDTTLCGYYGYGTINYSANVVSYDLIPSYCGLSDGGVTVSLPPGVGTSISWADGPTTWSRSGLSPGFYTYTIVDSAMCTFTDSVEIIDSCGTISGIVYDDVNGNGIQDAGEQPIPWTLIDLNGNVTRYTDINGNYQFDVGSGIHTVTPSNSAYTTNCFNTWVQVNPSYTQPLGGQYTVTINALNPVANNRDFGRQIPDTFDCGTISGYIFDDIDGDGIQDPNEGFLSGIKVQLLGGSILRYSDLNGYFEFTVPHGTYDLTVDPNQYYYMCGGWYPVTHQVTSPPSQNYSITTSSMNPVSTNNDFGVYKDDSLGCGNIYGSVYDDANSNGMIDAGEQPIPGALVTIGNRCYWTDNQGNYCISFPLDVQDTLTVYPQFCQTASYPTSGNYPIYLDSQNPTLNNLNFGISSPANCYNAGVYTLGVFAGDEAGETFHSWMDFKIMGNTTQPCTLRIDHDPLVSLKTSSLTPDNTGTDFVEWYFPAATYNYWHCMMMDWCVDSNATAGHVLHWEASIGCGSTDLNPSDDLVVRDVTISSGPLKTGALSTSANMLLSLDGTGVLPYSIDPSDSVISYYLFYQNLTDRTVHNVTAVFDLPDEIDPLSVTRAFSSFPNTSAVNNGQLVVDMPNVILKDTASDELNSYGFVQFNAKLKPGLPMGTPITNSAEVYFDYYESVASLQVENKIVGVAIEEVSDMSFSIYPNPTTGIFYIQLNPSAGEGVVQILDMMGREVLQQEVVASQALDLTGIAPGIYNVTLQTLNGQSSQQLMITQ